MSTSERWFAHVGRAVDQHPRQVGVRLGHWYVWLTLGHRIFWVGRNPSVAMVLRRVEARRANAVEA